MLERRAGWWSAALTRRSFLRQWAVPPAGRATVRRGVGRSDYSGEGAWPACSRSRSSRSGYSRASSLAQAGEEPSCLHGVESQRRGSISAGVAPRGTEPARCRQELHVDEVEQLDTPASPPEEHLNAVSRAVRRSGRVTDLDGSASHAHAAYQGDALSHELQYGILRSEAVSDGQRQRDGRGWLRLAAWLRRAGASRNQDGGPGAGPPAEVVGVEEVSVGLLARDPDLDAAAGLRAPAGPPPRGSADRTDRAPMAAIECGPWAGIGRPWGRAPRTVPMRDQDRPEPSAIETGLGRDRAGPWRPRCSGRDRDVTSVGDDDGLVGSASRRARRPVDGE